MSKLSLGLLCLGVLIIVALVVSNDMGLDWPPKTSHNDTIASTQTSTRQTNQIQKRKVKENLHASADTDFSKQEEATTADQETQDTTQASSDSNTQNNTPIDTQATSDTNPSPTSVPNDNNDTTPTPTQALQPIDTPNQTNGTDNNQNTQTSTDPTPGVGLNVAGLPISLGL